jgi:mannose-1-phosphate guanylyltransferase/mannose-6-phosphate isomerase
MKITPIILSGGCGSRLWPISRKLNPKQFSNFFGQESLFSQTLSRVKNSQFSDPIIVCNNEHRFMVAGELKELKIAAKSIILEPVSRNTAPAIAVAALDCMQQNKNDDLVLVLPSDHILEDKEEFLNSVKNAVKAAQDGYFVTFATKPNRAETGYGYIKKSAKIKNYPDVFAVEKFIEKPNEKRAAEFLKDKNYFWNCGIFLFRASIFLEELRKNNRDIFVNAVNAYSKASSDLDFIRLSQEDFEKCENISIDYALIEKLENLAMTNLNCVWSDVGSWQSVAQLATKDKNNNSLLGDVIAVDSENCYINSQDKLTAALGVKDLIVVVLKDAVLIANKNNAQNVKNLYQILQEKNRSECNFHAKTMRPWGSFEIIEVGQRFKAKKIIINPKAAISLQMHNHRCEHWVVVKGTAHVTCGSKEFVLGEDQSTYIPLGKKHRLENKGRIPLEIIEIQTGSYLEEDDIIRFSDIYGR